MLHKWDMDRIAQHMWSWFGGRGRRLSVSTKCQLFYHSVANVSKSFASRSSVNSFDDFFLY